MHTVAVILLKGNQESPSVGGFGEGLLLECLLFPVACVVCRNTYPLSGDWLEVGIALVLHR